MFPQLTINLAKPAARGVAGLSARVGTQLRFASGRAMPNNQPRGTAPAKNLDATFTIRNGPVFSGRAFGANSNISGEAVFTTSLVGYPESMTDPSYRGQILVFTQPLIGNYGVGSSLARISIGDEYDADEDESFIDPGQINLVKRVSTKAPFVVESPGANLHVALIDCGVKENIMRSLVSRGASVTVFPYNYPIHKVASHFDGVFISNGPGDPTHCQETIYNLGRLMETSSVCHITSQNHGYAVDSSTLPSDFKEYFVNLNDGSNEGMMHKTRPIFSTQFHPEAKGGPMDSSYLFDKYLQSVQLFKDNQKVYRDNRPTQLMLDILSRERVGVEPVSLASAA
ncbi:Carbamoyl-phosphate synthase arginine-specific small chain like protein [Verticillium longisporum]|uniref:Carbamoyl-phosphate synthase arginine-specific small chain like protein n=1 Tax=Verticillium longisporum TaxID=100787 RepID=A0A8I3ANB4_VERLO|nr:Carbamoyl-phosphate synthase arginine-specific small chain like protein [Verticillium longisporum]